MNQNTDINREDVSFNKKQKKRNKWGIYLSIILIIIGLIWYGVNVGIIPFTVIQEQAGPIIIVLLGILILIKSV